MNLRKTMIILLCLLFAVTVGAFAGGKGEEAAEQPAMQKEAAPEIPPGAKVAGSPEVIPGPDELIKPTPKLWPHTEVVPFHYPHPVTGKEWKG